MNLHQNSSLTKGDIYSVFAKVKVLGKNSFNSKSGKTCYVIYGCIMESASDYDHIQEGFKTTQAFVSADVFKDINFKDVIDGNMNYKDGMVSFWPYGMKRKQADVETTS